MSGIFYKGLILFFSLALSLSVATWSRARRELQAVTAANEFLRKTLGDLTIAIAEKDRELDRLAGFPCDGEKSHKLVVPDRRRDKRTGLELP
jgi:hypothetical protein